MNLQNVLARLAELETEVRASQDIEFVKNAQIEKDTLLARKSELEDLERRKADILNIQNGSGNILEQNQKPEQRNLVDSMEYRNAWLKNLQGKPLSVEERAMTAASAVVPTYTMDKVVEKLEQTSKLYQFISVSNVPGGLRVPVEDVTADATWSAAGTEVTASSDSLTYVDLGMHQLLKTIDLTENVLKMSIEAFENYIVNKLYKKMLTAVEKGVLLGTGSSQPTGLLKSGEITNTSTFTKAAITYADLCSIIGKLPTGYNPTFVLNRQTYATEIMGMVDDNNRPIAIVDGNSPTGFSILNYPAILDDNVSVDTILFGDLSYYQFNWGQDVDITSNASVGFKSGVITYRALAYGDGNKTSATAFVVATRATS